MDEYISREVALKKLIEGDGHDDDRFTEGYNFAVQEYREEIENIPAVEVQPVRHGRWISPVSVGNDIKFCSVCNHEAYWDTDYGQQLFDYCPYCGARMDGDGNE